MIGSHWDRERRPNESNDGCLMSPFPLWALLSLLLLTLWFFG